MGAYLVRRIAQFVPVLFVASIGIWAMAYALPGSPAQVLAGTDATPQQVAAIAKEMGLDRPLPVQYWIWLDHVFHGNLGQSYSSNLPVATLLWQRIPATAQLAVCSMIVGLVIAGVAGIVSALRPRSVLGRLAIAYQNIALAVPTFWLGILLVLAFSVKLRVLPATSAYIPIWESPVQGIKAITLPAIALGVHVSSITARFIRSSVHEAMGREFVRTARSKGVPEPAVVGRHALRNALLPVITVVGLQLASFLGGAVVTEVVFNYPGLGRLIYNAVIARDYTLIQGGVLFIACLFLVINLIVDVGYAYIDPRVRYA
jgi:peptide/nickel transport system permease protein